MKARFYVITGFFGLAGMLCLVVAAGLVFSRAQVETEIYRQRLVDLHGEFETLAGQFDRVVQRSAVTELEVIDGRINVLIRSANGVLECIPTRFSAADTIHVDFLVRDGRLWIRRIYDDQTPPEKGQVIDPQWAVVDWRDPKVTRGQTIYRGQLEDGRWVINVSGSGSMELVRVGPNEPHELVFAPQLLDAEELTRSIVDARKGVTTVDVLRRMIFAD